MVETSNISQKDQVVKEEILRAAEIVFQKWGLNKTTMEDIAREADKGKSTLYYYYKSKEEILEAVIGRQLEELLSGAKKCVASVSSSKEKLKLYVITSLKEIHKFGMVYSILRDDIKGNKALIEKTSEKIIESEKIFIKEILLAGIKSKELNFEEEELNVVATTVLGIIYALDMYLFMDDRDNIETSQKIEIMAKLIANGI